MTDQMTANDHRAAQAARRATVTVLGQPGTARLIRQSQLDALAKSATAAYTRSIGSTVAAGIAHHVGVVDQIGKSIAQAQAQRGLDVMLAR